MTTDRYLRFEYSPLTGMPDWQHWSDEPASQLIDELREASEGGRFRVRALDADGTVVAELNPVTDQREALLGVRVDMLLGFSLLTQLRPTVADQAVRDEITTTVDLMRRSYDRLRELTS